MSSEAEHLRDEGTRIQVVLAGATSGLVSRFCIAPLDVLKIRLQLQYHAVSDTPRGVVLVARDIFRHEGITGFWKGNIPAEALYLSYGAAQFLAYRTTNQAIEKVAREAEVNVPGTAKSFVSGALAGTAATAVTYPLDLLRTRFAAQGTERVYDGLVASLRDIRNTEGYAGFFRGVSAAVGQIVPYMGLYFAIYEGLKEPLAGMSLPFGSGDFVAGAAASISSKSAVYPLDTVRKRLQVQGPSRTKYIGGSRVPVYDQGIFRTMAHIARHESLKGLYRGLTVSLIKATPASAITMWTYERAIHFLMDAQREVVEEKERI